MWCVSCQHGHTPDELGICPCCSYRLIPLDELEIYGEKKNVIMETTVIKKDKEVVYEDSVAEEPKPVKKKRGRPRKKA